MKRFSNIVDKSKKKNMVGISCVVASIIIISSAIVVSLPSINFASIQESAFGNEVDDNFVLEENTIEEENTISENTVAENVIDNSVLVEDKSETENEVTSTEDAQVVKTKVTKIDYENKSIESDKKTKIVEAQKISYDETKNETWSLIWPVKEGTEISSQFGNRNGGIHTGIDFKVEEGDEIYAVADGVVVYAGYKGSYGYLVVIDHGNGFQTYYAHNQNNLPIKTGNIVKQGDIIAFAGKTGNCTGPTSHFETRIDGVAKNPLVYLP